MILCLPSIAMPNKYRHTGSFCGAHGSLLQRGVVTDPTVAPTQGRGSSAPGAAAAGACCQGPSGVPPAAPSDEGATSPNNPSPQSP